MSLISDALKEAQRERSERSGQPGAPPSADNFFPLPADREAKRSNPLVIGGTAAAALLVAAAVWWSTSHLFSHTTHEPLNVATKAAVRLPAPTTSTPSAATTPAPNATHDSARVVEIPAPPPAAARTRVAARPSRRSTQPRPAKPVVDTAAPTLVSTAAVQAPTMAPAPTSAESQSVRIIIDAPSSRPADSLFKLAYAEHLKGNFERAKELYEQTIAMQQAPSEAYNDYGVLLSQHGNPTAAAEMFRVAVRRDDANLEGWINLGDSYNVAGHHADALSAFSRALQLDPGNVAVKVRLAAEYHAIGDAASARRLYEESLKAAPKDPVVHYELAKFLQAQQDYRGAVREFQQFVDLAGETYDARTIDAVKQHVAALEKSAR